MLLVLPASAGCFLNFKSSFFFFFFFSVFPSPVLVFVMQWRSSEWYSGWWLRREGRSKVGVVGSSCQWHQLLVPVRVHCPRKKHPLIINLTLHLLQNMKMLQTVLISSWLLWRSSMLLWRRSSCKLSFFLSLLQPYALTQTYHQVMISCRSRNTMNQSSIFVTLGL